MTGSDGRWPRASNVWVWNASTSSTSTTRTTTGQDVLDSGFPALAELRGEGAVGAIGAGMNDAAVLARLVRETDMDIVMLAGRYTLLEQDSLDDLLPRV